MDLEVPLDLGKLQQFGQASFQGGFYLPLVLPEGGGIQGRPKAA